MQNTTQKKVKQRCLYGEQFMDSKGLQGVLGYISGLQGKREVLEQPGHLDGVLSTGLCRDPRAFSVVLRPESKVLLVDGRMRRAVVWSPLLA